MARLEAVRWVYRMLDVVSFLRRHALEWSIIGLVIRLHHWVHALDVPWLEIAGVVGGAVKLAWVHHSTWVRLAGSVALQGQLLVGHFVGRVHVHIPIRLSVLVWQVLIGSLCSPLAVVVLESGAVIKWGIRGHSPSFWLAGCSLVSRLAAKISSEGGQSIQWHSVWFVSLLFLKPKRSISSKDVVWHWTLDIV